MKQQLQEFVRSALIIAAAVMVAGAVLYLSLGEQLFSMFSPTPSQTVTDNPPIATEVCEPITVQTEGKVAVLRVDDVQAFAWGETTRHMIDDALARSIPLTLGIIPKGFSDDVNFHQYLAERACNLEFALHGWDHQVQRDGVTPEFAGLSQQVAETRLERGLKELAAAGISSVKTWIPPQNVHSDGTVAALESLGFTRLSTEGEGVWDYDASSYAYDTDKLLQPAQVVADCELQIDTDGKCVIMMHPQVYANGLDHNPELYQEYYVELLTLLQAGGYSFARFEDLDS